MRPPSRRRSPIPELATSATSVTTFTNDQASARQLFVIGGMVMTLKDSGRLRPYVTGGAGIVRLTGDAPSATLTGLYEFGSAARVAYADSVTLQTVVDRQRPAAMVGGGIKAAIASRLAVRVEARARFYRSPVTNLVSTTATKTLRSADSPFPSATVGELQFSATAPMGAPPVNAATTLDGSSIFREFSLTAGLAWRF